MTMTMTMTMTMSPSDNVDVNVDHHRSGFRLLRGRQSMLFYGLVAVGTLLAWGGSYSQQELMLPVRGQCGRNVDRQRRNAHSGSISTSLSYMKKASKSQMLTRVSVKCTLFSPGTDEMSSACSMGLSDRAASTPARRQRNCQPVEDAAMLLQFPGKRTCQLCPLPMDAHCSRLRLSCAFDTIPAELERERGAPLKTVARTDRTEYVYNTTLQSAYYLYKNDTLTPGRSPGRCQRLLKCIGPNEVPHTGNPREESPFMNPESFEAVGLTSINRVPLAVLTFLALALLILACPSVVKELSAGKVTARKCLDDQRESMLRRPSRIAMLHNGKGKFARRYKPIMFPLGSWTFLFPFLSSTAMLLLSLQTLAMTDLRGSIIEGREPCFHYTMEKAIFHMNCSVLHWQALGYGPDTYISLSANEIFDGGGTLDNGESYIDLSGIIDFEGLFTVKDVEVATFNEAPMIRNVHVRDGTVASNGGFIVRKEQKYFIVDSCSSSGDIAGSNAGGICGDKSGFNNGEIKILNSYSTGKIMGHNAGGITGSDVGYNGGIVHITQCYSIGNIEGSSGGGICGFGAGRKDGHVYIKQSYSTGDIVSGAYQSGGIVGISAGYNKGYVDIQECYSTGQILADYSGGITGSHAANEEGDVHIIDCYTRGDIDGEYAGGITGWYTGGSGSGIENFGDVHITNTYASGIVKHVDAGGIIGRIGSNFQGHTIHVKYSVYNDPEIIGRDDGNHLVETGNFNDLSAIRGQLYQYEGVQRWNNTIWVINGTDTLPLLRFQLPSPTPSSTTTSTPTSSKTSSPTRTTTRTATSSTTSTPTKTSTPTTTSSQTVTPTPTSSMTTSVTSSRTGTMTTTPTPTKTGTATVTSSSTRTQTTTSTFTGTSTGTRTATLKKTPSASAATLTSSSSPSSISCSPKPSRNPYSERCVLDSLAASNISEYDVSEMDYQFLTFQTKIPDLENNSAHIHFTNLLPYLAERLGYSVFSNGRTVCVLAGLKVVKNSSGFTRYSNDVCCSTSEEPASCSQVPISSSPKPRAFASSWSKGANHYIFGGQGQVVMDGMHGLLNDLWKYDMYLGEWTWVSINDGPSARRDASTWVLKDSFLLYGGYGMGATGSSPNYLDDLWKLQDFPRCSGGDHEWIRLKPWSLTGNSPYARRLASVTVMDSLALLFGGEGFARSKGLNQPYLSDLWVLEFCEKNESWAWKELTLNEDAHGFGGRVGVFLTIHEDFSQDAAFHLSFHGGFGYQNGHSTIPQWQGDTWSMMLSYNHSSLP